MEKVYRRIIKQLADKEVNLVLVSKRKPVELIKKFYDWGHRDFGENRVQELVEKYENLPKDIKWHLIGHLQKNKVKYIAPFVHLIHAVDNLELLIEIDKRAKANNRVIDVLLQLKIAQEESKFGLSKEGIISLLESDACNKLSNIRIVGLMGMATNTPDREQIKNEFNTLHEFFLFIQKTYFNKNNSFKEISMGMSGDYEIAIEEGATMVRIGSLILGARTY